jgi:hypothetical protein
MPDTASKRLKKVKVAVEEWWFGAFGKHCACEFPYVRLRVSRSRVSLNRRRPQAI